MVRSSLNISKGEIIVDIRSVARVLNHSPSSVEYMRFGRYDVKTVRRKLNGSWSRIVHSAGLRYTLRTCRRIPSTQELKCDLLRVMREVHRPPKRAEYEARGSFGAETIKRRCGKKTWADAVASLADVHVEEVKFSQQRGGCYRTTDEWFLRVRELSKILGHAPTMTEANEGGINGHQLCRRINGRWVDVLEAAKIDLRTRTKHARVLGTSTEILIQDVVAVSRRLGRPAKVHEYESHGKFHYTAVRGRLGGWRKVKKIVSDQLLHPQNRFDPTSESATFGSNPALREAVNLFFAQDDSRRLDFETAKTSSLQVTDA